MKQVDPYATCQCCGELLRTISEGLDEMCKRCASEINAAVLALIHETKVRP